MRLAILESDTALPGIAKRYGGYGDLFKVLLNTGARAEGYEKVDDALNVSIYHVEDDLENYPDLKYIDALLLTGSHRSNKDNWYMLRPQIIARALGAPVGRNKQGWEAAVCNVQLTLRGQEIFRTKGLRIYQSHRDMVFQFSEGVESLGSSSVCAVQGMYDQKRLIPLQGHPEFNGMIMQEIIDTRHKTGAFEEDAYQRYAKKVYLPHNGETIGAALVRFLLEEKV